MNFDVRAAIAATAIEVKAAPSSYQGCRHSAGSWRRGSRGGLGTTGRTAPPSLACSGEWSE